MSAKAIRRLIYTELLLTLREPAAMFLAVILPLAVFLALGFSVGDAEIPVNRETGIVELFHVRDVLLAGNIAWVAAIFGLISLPQTLVEFRQYGVFRRYRVTPMPAYLLIIAPLVVGAAVIPTVSGSHDRRGLAGIRHPLRRQRSGGDAGDIRLVPGLCRSGGGYHRPDPQRSNRVGIGLALFAPMFVLSGRSVPGRHPPPRSAW